MAAWLSVNAERLSSDYRNRPRQTVMAGRRKPTHRWCARCERLHRTHRHALGQELCPFAPTHDLPAGMSFPAIRIGPGLGPQSPFNPMARRGGRPG